MSGSISLLNLLGHFSHALVKRFLARPAAMRTRLEKSVAASAEHQDGRGRRKTPALLERQQLIKLLFPHALPGAPVMISVTGCSERKQFFDFDAFSGFLPARGKLLEKKAPGGNGNAAGAKKRGVLPQFEQNSRCLVANAQSPS